jgi:predicted DCC family thiol-disulfide oxidoreductase YuxK
MTAATTDKNKTAATALPDPDERPEADIVIYDGHCAFCRASVERLRWWDCRNRLAYLSLHDPRVAQRYPDLSHERLMREMVVVDRQGRYHGGAAGFRYLTRRLRRLWWLMPLMHIPFSLPLWQGMYRQIAKRRYGIAGKIECADGTCHLHERN